MLFGKRTQVVKRILVVEDEPLTAFDNETLIESAGYEVVATRDNVADALAILDDHAVDLILADVKLSGARSGIDLARAAQKRGVPVLLATGRSPREAAEVAVGCLMKPYSARVLKEAIRAVEDHLEGKSPKLPKGLELFPIAAA
ncbi:MAG: response regulator [Pseudomonadota bacterium]|nr:response regulator [Pseudomonadota bacterium]